MVAAAARLSLARHRLLLWSIIGSIFIVGVCSGNETSNTPQISSSRNADADIIARLDALEAKLMADASNSARVISQLQSDLKDAQNQIVQLQKQVLNCTTTNSTAAVNLLQTQMKATQAQMAALDKKMTDGFAAIQKKLPVKPSVIPSDGGRMPETCTDLQQLGHSNNGFYTVKSTSNANTTRLITVYCIFSMKDEVDTVIVGYNDVKTINGVYFYVQRETSYSITDSAIPYEVERLNIGDGMNMTTGVFTAPTGGLYHFTFTASSYSVYTYVYLRVNGDQIGISYARTKSNNLPISNVLSLQIRDQVDMYLRQGSLFDNSNHFAHFSGILLEENLVL